MPRWYTWGLLTPGIFWLDRRLVETFHLAVRIAFHIPLGAAWTSFGILLRLTARPLRGAPLPDDFGAFFFERFYPDLVIYGVIACVSLLLAYSAHMKRRERVAQDRALGLERRLGEARFDALRAQLQPHFLFNALNTISACTETDARLARRLMEQLGDLLRASLRHTAQPFVTLGEELTFLDNYLAIESARFEDRIVVSVHADETLVDLPVPSFLFQPLVENAIRHGVAPRLSGGRIEVSAARAGDQLVLRVHDDGVGLPAGWAVEQNGGVGLRNLQARLHHVYGQADLLRVRPLPTGGVDATVTVPMTPPSPRAGEPDERRAGHF
jgi:signal transduction histidine kinase